MATRKPTHDVYTITPYGDGQSYWTKVGAAWENQDGSLNLKLNALPVNGELHVRKPSEKK